MMKFGKCVMTALAASALVAAPSGCEKKEDAANFYKGKTVTYIVATASGGGYDSYRRLVADFMQKYLPGSKFVVKNMPGAGHLIGANAIYASKPDGLTIGTIGSRSSFEGFVKNGYGRFIAQIGGKDKDVPQLSSLVTDPNGKVLVALIESQGEIASHRRAAQYPEGAPYGAA